MTSLCRCMNFTLRRARHANSYYRHVTAIHRVQRCYSSEVLPSPVADGEVKEYPAKIQSLVDDISRLTLSEISDLNQLLKVTLKIQDAPMMVAGAMPAAGAPTAEAEEEDEDAAPKSVKTHFAVKLTKFDAATKVKLIKEIKSLTTGMNLVQAKKFVESAPQVVRGDISKDEAEEIKQKIEAAGGTVVIE
ncbi:large ribosomal subunit protein bL12m-like [Glandiceps talaboti]